MKLSSARLVSRSAVERWAEEADVIVVGLGAAGACAALAAVEQGGRVVALESAEVAGGTSARSSGQLYLGGGTALQRRCGFDDSPAEMAKYMKLACGPGADEEKIELYCRESAEHYDWLVARGVPFRDSFVPTTVATNPPGDDGLTYTGSELAYPYRDQAVPAPRGHNVKDQGDSGAVLMRALLQEVERARVDVRTEATVVALVVDEGSGRIVGVGVQHGEEREWMRAAGGVVIATGGFGFNRDMLARYAPRLLRCSPVGTPFEDGLGIVLGMAAGGDAVRMDAGCVILPYSKPRSLTKGVLVNSLGDRFVAEDVYQADHGDIALNRQEGVVYLIVDDAVFETPQLPFPVLGTADTYEALSDELGLPRGRLSATMATYNDGAARGEDPLFRKSQDFVVPLTKPPFRAIDLRVTTFPYPFFTLGGLRTTCDGEVMTPDGEVVPGLFAAGRSTSGLPADGYNSGMSLADATYFGRRAGHFAAAG